MGYIKGVNLLPATGEWTYDATPYLGRRVTELALTPINTYFASGGQRTDLDYSIDQLQAEFPDCETVAIVVAWFGDSVDASSCRIYPSTTYIGGVFEKWDGAGWAPDVWRCSGLTQTSPELIPISSNGASFNYGGTPSDQSIVRCIRDMKARGLRVVFYPFLLMDAPGFPWRGRIAYQSDDVSSGASAAAANFLGAATAAQFVRDTANLTVAYTGATTDYSFRRMILHYANLCVVGGGVDLFLLGSELRGLETIRGPAWTKAGTRDASGAAVWDYPFVSGLMTLCDDVRSVFDQAGLTKDETGLHNLISYAADWSAWMGYQHPAADGQWPHLDQLWAHENIDLVCFDNYLPLSDWTTGGGGIDAGNWASPRPSSWPPPDVSSVGLGLTGPPTLTSKAYLKANIEGGEKFNWFYGDSTNLGRGLDPNGTDLRVSLPRGDRLAQDRQPYYANQELLANKKLRWWWNNSHRAIYDDGDGNGFAAHGPSTAWTAQSKPITFTEYGFPTCDRATNQPNVFFDAKSSESATPFWSVWQPAEVGGYAPAEDANLTLLALQAIYEYWVEDGQNETSAAGVKMIEPTFMSAWNWDARPFPAFPARSDVWGDAANWPSGNWLSGKGPFIPPPVLDLAPTPASPPSFPTLNGQSWSVHYKPSFSTVATERASGRASRVARMATAVWEIELSFDALRMDDVHHDLEVLAGFYESARGQTTPFAFPVSPALGLGPTVLCRFADDQADLEAFMNQIWQAKTVVLRTVKGMTPAAFPTLPGQAWSVHKRPTFSTRIVSNSSGREARTPLYTYPLYEFELTFEGLASTSALPGLGANSLQSLLGLYLQCQGQFGTFLYTDPGDSAMVGQAIAVGDGVTTAFPFVRTLGGFTEPVGWVLSVQNVYLDGARQTGGWTLSTPNNLTFLEPPASNVFISADFIFAFECRFLDDQNDFENFMAGLWQVQSLKFRSVKP